MYEYYESIDSNLKQAHHKGCILILNSLGISPIQMMNTGKDW